MTTLIYVAIEDSKVYSIIAMMQNGDETYRYTVQSVLADRAGYMLYETSGEIPQLVKLFNARHKKWKFCPVCLDSACETNSIDCGT